MHSERYSKNEGASNENYEVKVLGVAIEHGREIVDGKMIFANTTIERINKCLASAGAEIYGTPLETEARKLLRELPAAEIRNRLQKARKLDELGLHYDAASWRHDAIAQAKDLHEGGTVSDDDYNMLTKLFRSKT